MFHFFKHMGTYMNYTHGVLKEHQLPRHGFNTPYTFAALRVCIESPEELGIFVHDGFLLSFLKNEIVRGNMMQVTPIFFFIPL